MKNDYFAVVEAKVAGCYVPGHVRRALATAYPDVKLLWNYHYKRWVMAEVTQSGELVPFRMLGTAGRYEMPSMKNTCEVLHRQAQIKTRMDRIRFLNEMNSKSPDKAIQKDAMERVREGTREMVKHVLQPKTAVRIPWATRSPHQN